MMDNETQGRCTRWRAWVGNVAHMSHAARAAAQCGKSWPAGEHCKASNSSVTSPCHNALNDSTVFTAMNHSQAALRTFQGHATVQHQGSSNAGTGLQGVSDWDFMVSSKPIETHPLGKSLVRRP